MIIFQIIAVLLVTPAACIAFYYTGLAFMVIFTQNRKMELTEDGQVLRFAVIVPAHNEETAIGQTLKSCFDLNYPRDQFTVFVIADNCTDGTARVAKDAGATVLERTNHQLRGKGYALEWALGKILPLDFEAILIIDADCTIDATALSVFSGYFKRGALALQSNDVVSNPDESALSYALAVGNIIENDLFYAPKSRLKLAVFLRGTGMVFHRKLLELHPWKSGSIVEDADYSLTLLKKGVPVIFVPEIKVSSAFPAEKNQFTVQRNRWAQGNLNFGKTQSLKLMLTGLLSGNLRLFDGGWTLLVLSKPLVLLETVVAFFAGATCYWLSPGNFSYHLFFLSAIILFLQLFYLLMGILKLGLNMPRFRLLLQAPAMVIKLVMVSINGLIGNVQTIWARTPR